jgi:hypothetical protein
MKSKRRTLKGRQLLIGTRYLAMVNVGAHIDASTPAAFDRSWQSTCQSFFEEEEALEDELKSWRVELTRPANDHSIDTVRSGLPWFDSVVP